MSEIIIVSRIALVSFFVVGVCVGRSEQKATLTKNVDRTLRGAKTASGFATQQGLPVVSAPMGGKGNLQVSASSAALSYRSVSDGTTKRSATFAEAQQTNQTGTKVSQTLT